MLREGHGRDEDGDEGVMSLSCFAIGSLRDKVSWWRGSNGHRDGMELYKLLFAPPFLPMTAISGRSAQSSEGTGQMQIRPRPAFGSKRPAMRILSPDMGPTGHAYAEIEILEKLIATMLCSLVRGVSSDLVFAGPHVCLHSSSPSFSCPRPQYRGPRPRQPRQGQNAFQGPKS